MLHRPLSSRDDEFDDDSSADYKLSDVEDYQQDVTGAGNSGLMAGGGTTIMDDDMDDAADGEQQLDALAN
jgi:hypothetical protein